MAYSDQQKAVFVLKFAEEDYNYAKFTSRIRLDARRNNPQIPDVKTIENWLNSFLSTGSVHSQRGKIKPQSVSTDDAIEDVHETFTANPHLSTRRNPFVSTPPDSDDDLAEENTTQMSRTTLCRILKEDLKMKPYNLKIAHALRENDCLSSYFCSRRVGSTGG